MKSLLPVVALLALALPGFAGEAGPEREGRTPNAAVQAEGRELMEENCLACHDDSYITSMNLTREQWDEVMELMLGMGMPPLEPEVHEKVLDYLEEEHGPGGGSGEGDAAGGEASSASGPMVDLPWAYPRYRPNPLIWRER